MDTIVERCCGLDVHQAKIVACLLVGHASQKPRKEVKTFRAMTQDLLALRDWLLPELKLALEGSVQEHHRFLLRLQLRRLKRADEDLAELEQRVDERLEPYREQQALLVQIPGIDRIGAAVIIAELGTDMTVFHSAKHLAAWAGVCPGNNESAGKRKSDRVRSGNVHLKTALVEAANAASRKKGSYLKDKFFRLKARRGHKRAAIAIAHKILIAAYHMLSTGSAYKDLGEPYLDRVAKHRVTSQLVHRLERLGYDVQLIQKVA